MEHIMAAKDAIKRARYKLGYNQTEFAKLLGVHKSVISMYENGTRKPSFPKIREFVKTLSEHGLEMKYEDFVDEEKE